MSIAENCKRIRAHDDILHSFGYAIGSLIGEGTYSKVCVAICSSRDCDAPNCKPRDHSHFRNHHSQSRKVACKIINRVNAGKEFITKFLPRELEIIRFVKHPNIVETLDILEISNVVYIFMEYCRHGDLLDFIRQNGALSENRSKYYFRQLVSAVKYLHGLNIAHRDLKCENILMVNEFQLKLADFGFSCSCVGCGKPCLSSTFCGSAAYAAPEILQGIPYDAKSFDIWALGCILYIMVTSVMPFDDTNIMRMLKSQLNKTVLDNFRPWDRQSETLEILLGSLLEPNMRMRASIIDANHSSWLQEGLKFKMKTKLIADEVMST